MSIFFTKKKSDEPDVVEYNGDDEETDNIFSGILEDDKSKARKKRFVEVD